MNKSFVLKIFGLFLIGEAIASMVYSQDKRSISNTGRMARIVIGFVLLTIKI